MRLAPGLLNWKFVVQEVVASALADVVVQFIFDVQDPFLTPQQIGGGLWWRAQGGGASGWIGVVVAAKFGGLTGFAISIGIELVWQYAITPAIYKLGGLEPERRLLPVGGY